MAHPAFSEAGQNPGIEVWTIDKFEPVPIESKSSGKFYNGDSYIVLKTTGDKTKSLAYDAHFWLGSKTTQDKKGSAAILTVSLDDTLGGRAVHHREVQGHESSLFLGYFQPAIRYLEGGNESGFNEVETNTGAEKRLLKLSGCDNLRIEEVPAEASSLTKDNCFVLEVDHDIFVLVPEGAKATQRRKIIAVANSLRDDYHNGRATIEIIDEFSSDEDVALFFEALGSGSKDDLAEESAIELYSRASVSDVYLYKVLAGDEMELVALNKPYKQKQLSSDEIYILDTPCSGVYVWLGKDVEEETRKNYHDFAQQYLDLKDYPSWVNITRVSEGAECSTFKQYFHNWDTVAAGSFYTTETDAGYFSGDADEAAAAAYQIGKSASARGLMPDTGNGQTVFFRVAGGVENVTEKFAERDDLVILYQKEVYVIDYKYTLDDGGEGTVVYLWVGADADDADKAKGLELVAETEEGADNAIIVQVPQGKETKHFLSLFKGHLVILIGGADNGYKPENSKNSYDEDGIRLFRVEGTESGVDMRAVQVLETAEVLEDDDVFVLETPDVVYVRNGKESDRKEQEAALAFVTAVVGEEREVKVLLQGEEPEEFWNALGGPIDEKEDGSGWRQTVSRRVTTPPSLTAVTVSVTGKIKFEELPPSFTQQDLSDDGIYILDAGEELYLWQGVNTPERVKRVRTEIVVEYLKDDGLERTPSTTVVVGVKQAVEPEVFKKYFPSWEADMWDNQMSYEDAKNEAKAANSK